MNTQPTKSGLAPLSVNDNAGGGKPLLSADKLTTVLHDFRRWKILRELARGDALPVSEISRRVSGKSNSVQKNMAILKDAKLVVQTYGRLYRLAPELAVSADGRQLDLGFCILCLDKIAP